MVGLISLLRGSGLWLRAGRAHPSWRLWKGVTFLWAPLRLPTSLPLALPSSASRDPLSFFKTSAFLLYKGSIWLDQTRSEISLHLKSNCQRSCGHWQVLGVGMERGRACHLLPPRTGLNLSRQLSSSAVWAWLFTLKWTTKMAFLPN